MRRPALLAATAALGMAVALPSTAVAADGVTISGAVWLDLDGDGERDAGEPGRAGVAVTLQGTAAIVDAAVSDGDGVFTFEQVQAGDYTVVVEPPIDHDVTTDQAVVGGRAEIPLTVTDIDLVDIVAVGLGSPVTSGPDMTANVYVDPDGGDGSDEHGWIVAVHNLGPDDAEGLIDVRLVLSSGHEALDAQGEGWVCDVGSSIVTCDVTGGLPAGQGLAPIALTTRATSGIGSTIGVTATVRLADVFDAAPLNDEDDASTTVTAGEEITDVDGDGAPDLTSAGAPASRLLVLALLAMLLGATGLSVARRS